MVFWHWIATKKKRLKRDLDKRTENFSLGHVAFYIWPLWKYVYIRTFQTKIIVKNQLPQHQSNWFLEFGCQTPQKNALVINISTDWKRVFWYIPRFGHRTNLGGLRVCSDTNIYDYGNASTSESDNKSVAKLGAARSSAGWECVLPTCLKRTADIKMYAFWYGKSDDRIFDVAKCC